MTDPRNVAHDKRVQQEKKHNGVDADPHAAAQRPGMKPHAPAQHEPANAATGHGPDSDEAIDKTETGQEP